MSISMSLLGLIVRCSVLGIDFLLAGFEELAMGIGVAFRSAVSSPSTLHAFAVASYTVDLFLDSRLCHSCIGCSCSWCGDLLLYYDVIGFLQLVRISHKRVGRGGSWIGIPSFLGINFGVHHPR